MRVHLQFGRVGEVGRLGHREHFLPREKTSKVQTRVDDKGIYLCKSNQRGPTNKNGGALLQEIIKTCVALKALACCLRMPAHVSNVRLRQEKTEKKRVKKTMRWLRITGYNLSAADYDGGKTRGGHF